MSKGSKASRQAGINDKRPLLADHHDHSRAHASPTREQHDQVTDENLVDELDEFMTAMDHAVADDSGPPTTPCPYHWALLQLGLDGEVQTEEQARALDQYLVEAAANQPSMFLGADGKLSTRKDCNCWMAGSGRQA